MVVPEPELTVVEAFTVVAPEKVMAWFAVMAEVATYKLVGPEKVRVVLPVPVWVPVTLIDPGLCSMKLAGEAQVLAPSVMVPFAVVLPKIKEDHVF